MLKFKKLIIPTITGLLVVLAFLIFPQLYKDKPADLQKYLYYSTRLILLFYIYLSMYFYFVEELGNKAEFQKLFFKGVVLSLIFTAFTSVGLFLNYFQDSQSNIEGFSVFKIWYLQVSKFLKIGLIYTVVVLIILHLHPQNLLKKSKNQSKPIL